MKQDRVRRAAFAVRAPTVNLIVNERQSEERRYVVACEGRARARLRQGFIDDPSLLEPPPLPPDNDKPRIRRKERSSPVIDWPNFFQHEQAPAPPSDDLHAGETIAVQSNVQAPTGRSFWSYANEPALK